MNDASTIIIVLACLMIFGLIGVILYLVLRRSPLQAQPDSVLLQHLEPIRQVVGDVQIELRSLNERVQTMDRQQAAAGQSINTLEKALLNTSGALSDKIADAKQTSTDTLKQVQAGIVQDLAHVQSSLAVLQSAYEARREVEQRTAESIRRLEAVIAGTQSRGAAGENIVEAVFSQLPVDWQLRNYTIGGNTVEFALRLPNNLVLPIDSKWTAVDLVDRYATCSDPSEQKEIKKDIGSAVLKKAKEVCKYVDPTQTVPFGLAVVPDIVYDLCSGVHVDIFRLNIVLVSYSMFIPYLLLVYQTILKTNQNIDLHRLEAYLKTVEQSIGEVQDELDGRFSRAVTMLSNSRDDMRSHISKANSSLTSVYSAVPAASEQPMIGGKAEE